MLSKRILLFLIGWMTAIPVAKADFYSGLACPRTANNDGMVCQFDNVSDKATGFHYSDPIIILIPDGVVQPTQAILHFVGFRNVCNDDTVNDMLNNFGFLGLMPQAKAMNSILIIPRSEGQETTLNDELAPQFDVFVKWLYNTIGAQSLTWTITGHSGAYLPIGTVLAQEGTANKARISIQNIVLLDATYSSRKAYYQEWNAAAKANPHVGVYSVTSADTATGTSMLKTQLKPYKIPITVQTATTTHCDIPKTDLGPILNEIIGRR